MRFGLIANPENRRATLFREAVERAGLPQPAQLAWSEILSDPDCLDWLGTCERIRIDSCGEHAEVLDALIRQGGGPDTPGLAFGEIRWQREAHLGFCEVLQELEARKLPLTNHPEDIRTMFDKWASHKRFAAAGVPRPRTWLLQGTPDAFREHMAREALHRVFLKPLHGSSASGVCAYRWRRDREQLIAPIEIDTRSGSPQLFNTLRIRSYTERSDIDLILGRLLPDGMVCEDWLHKAWLDGMAFDLRIVTIAGKARHTVVRQSRHAMTNLHLGNERGSLESFRKSFGEDVYQACRHAAEQAAACFPRSLVTGVDVAVTKRKEVAVLEINAFGDLLPGILDRGESTYEAVVSAMQGRA